MQVADIQKTVPQNSPENVDVPQPPVQEQVANDDEFGGPGLLIRDITAFGDCV
jgi:hypothetical protein